MALLRWQRTITDEAGNVLPGASIEIRNEETGTLVPLFEDRAGAVSKGNPITADSNGYAFAYFDSVRFKVTATSGALTAEWPDVRLPEDTAAEIAEHVAETDPHTQYAQLSGGADANFTAMPQVGGDPIVESGSNADGEWTRWADGTQRCSQFFRLDSVLTATIIGNTWTFPQLFVSPNPQVTHTPEQGGASDASGIDTARRGMAFHSGTGLGSVSVRNGAVSGDSYTAGDFINTAVVASGYWK